MADASVVFATKHPSAQVNGILAAAQAYALEHQLPLAVAHCIETTNGEAILHHLGELADYEMFLAKHHIPLMVLLGATDTVLPWFMSHTKPKKVFTDDSEPIAATIQDHTYHWPGRVMTTAELHVMVAGDSNYCRPDSKD